MASVKSNRNKLPGEGVNKPLGENLNLFEAIDFAGPALGVLCVELHSEKLPQKAFLNDVVSDETSEISSTCQGQVSWLHDPLSAFAQWSESSLANQGRGFSGETRKVYSAMWGKFCRFCSTENQKAALADEQLILSFIQHLEQERQQLRHRAQVSQKARSRDSAGVGRQARRYLYLLSKVYAALILLEIRSVEQGNAGQALLDRFEPEPRRPMPSALKPQNQTLLRSSLVKMGASNDWRTIRDRAIVEMIFGSGLTSRQLRMLTIEADCVNLDDSPAWVHPVPARRGQPRPTRIPISREAANTVRNWMQVRQGLFDGVTLFPSTLSGEPMSSSSLYRCVASAIELAKEREDLQPASHVGPRTLRHTFAVRQIRAGRPMEVLQQWLGHAQSGSTEVYKRIAPDPLGYEPV